MVYLGIYDINLKEDIVDIEILSDFPSLAARGNWNTDWSMAFISSQFITHSDFYDLATSDIKYFEETYDDYENDNEFIKLKEFINNVQANFNDETNFRIYLLN